MSALGAQGTAHAHGWPQCRRQPWHRSAPTHSPLPSTSGRQHAATARELTTPYSDIPSYVPGLASFTYNESDSVLQLSFLDAQIDALSDVCKAVHGRSAADQVKYFSAQPIVTEVLKINREVADEIAHYDDEARSAVLATISAGQAHVVTLLPEQGDWQHRLRDLATDLVKVQKFYDSLGGIVGYQLKCLQLIRDAYQEEEDDALAAPAEVVNFLVPQGPNLQGPDGRANAHRAALDGLKALPNLAEIYPLGGAGDRLGLICEDTQQPLPAAMLPYCGRPMLDGLIRDLQAREYLHYRLTGEQHTTPVAIMTSDAKDNHNRISEMLEERDFYGRPRDSFRLFCQPLVPVLEAETGAWVLPEALKPSLKPGGHGAIWKLMHDHGIFEWLQSLDREAALIRQISNPMASTDCTMLALAGEGYSSGRIFGFASCNRVVGAAEGMNVLIERARPASSNGNGANGASGDRQYEYGVSNIEYTEFARLGIEDQPRCEGSEESCYPANTNILYVGLRAAAAAVARGIESGGGASLPGMIFNLKKQISYRSAVTGVQRSVQAGRMECTMQNLADELVQRFPERLCAEATADLDTFVVYNERRYVTSSAKRARVPGSERIHQTPEGSFRDLMLNAVDMLGMCNVTTPEIGTVKAYLAARCAPAFVWLWNPALGPLWQVVAEKVQRGRIAPQSEVVLEVAELRWRDVDVKGSLLVKADNIVGESQAAYVRFSDACARVRLENVRIENAGIDYEAASNCFWKHQVQRRAACNVALRGVSEFEARDVSIVGDASFTVPHGHRMLVVADENSAQGFRTVLEPLEDGPTWWWTYSISGDGTANLNLHEAARLPEAVTAQRSTA